MTTQLALVLGLLVAAIVMFARNRPRMDAVALIMLTVLPFTGVITMGEALTGFSDANIVLIAALFVIGDGLVRTGLARGLGDWLIAKAGTSEIRLIVLLMLVVSGLGSMMSSTAVTAIFIPVALRIAQSAGTSASRLMMPLSFAALISGMLTLVGTAPNLVVNSELVRHGAQGFHFFSITPFGLPILVLGILYMVFARRWLAERKSQQGQGPRYPSLQNWIDEYKLAGREYRVRVTDQSPLVGKTVGELKWRDSARANLLAIERKRGLAVDIVQPTAKTEVHADDILLIDLFKVDSDIEAIEQKNGVERMPLTGAYFADRSQDIGMAEVFVPANSDLIGQTVTQVSFRAKFGLTVIGLRRGIVAHGLGLLHEELGIGDTLLVIGPWKAIQRLQAGSKDLLVLSLPTELAEVLPVAGKAPQAIVCLALVVVLMVTGVVPNVQAALIGCLLMGALRVVNLESAYRSIDWKTLVLIVGMLPFSTALQRTGGVDLGAHAMMALTASVGTHGVLACLFVITAVLGLFISNTATAVLMAPVAIAVAKDLQASPYPFAMIVGLAASTAFMTPVSSPVNTLVVTPGNYAFGDFVRVGVPFSIVVMVVSVLLVPWLMPLY